MKNLNDAIDHILKHDVLLLAYLGLDVNQQPKVYQRVAPPNSTPPYVVWSRVGGEEALGTFADDEAILRPQFQISAWADQSSPAWELLDVVHEALRTGEWDVLLIPYKRMRLVSSGDELELTDPETQWVHVPRTYRIAVSR